MSEATTQVEVMNLVLNLQGEVKDLKQHYAALVEAAEDAVGFVDRTEDLGNISYPAGLIEATNNLRTALDALEEKA